MNRMRQHRLTLALLFSLSLHLVALGSPGWHVPTLDDLLSHTEEMETRLDARLVIPATIPAPAADVRLNAPRATKEPSRITRSFVPVSRPASTVSASSGVLSMPPVQPATGEGEQQDVAGVERVKDESEQGSVTDDALSSGAALASANTREHLASEGRMTGAGTKDERQSTAASRLQLPRRGHVRFNVTRGGQGFVMGQSVHHWNHDDKSYVLNSVTETTGLIAWFRSVRVVWLSQGAFGHDGLHPNEFRTEKDGVRSDAATLDWPAMKLTLSDGNGRVRDVPLQPGTQDVLSMFYQLGSLVFQGTDDKDARAVAGVSFYVTTGRKLERYRFDMLGDEMLTVPQRGHQRALHVRTLAGDQTIDVWLAYDLRGLPIRIRYTDGKGDRYDQMADEIEFEDKVTQAPTPGY